jgi:steroid delta-isomerase-like uncharacterized protein
MATSAVAAADVRSFIEEYFRAWQGTDEGHILSYYSDDVALEIPGALMSGKEAVRDHFVRPFIAAFPGNLHIAKNMIFGANVVVVEWSFEAQHKGPFAGRPATGVQVKVPGCSVYEHNLAKRQITGGRIYFDSISLLKQIGAA